MNEDPANRIMPVDAHTLGPQTGTAAAARILLIALCALAAPCAAQAQDPEPPSQPQAEQTQPEQPPEQLPTEPSQPEETPPEQLPAAQPQPEQPSAESQNSPPVESSSAEPPAQSPEAPAEPAADSSSPSDTPPASTEVPIGQAGPIEGCSQRDEAEASFLERMRSRLTVTACASSAWLDSLFGDQLHYSDYRETYGSVSAGGLWSRYDGFDPRLRFRVRLQLPQWNERISAFAGRVGENDYISDTEGDFDALPTRQFGNLEDESVLVGLGYSSPKRTGNDFDAGVGVRLDLPLDPYGRARYEIVRAFAERYVFSIRETVFWQNSEGFGTTTRVNLDRAVTDRMMLRWSNVGKFTEETLGLEWYSQLTLFQSINERTGLAWQAQVEGATDNEVQLTRHAVRLIMRRQLTAEWLFLELRAGVGWPRRKLTEAREASPEVGIALEMQFGERER